VEGGGGGGIERKERQWKWKGGSIQKRMGGSGRNTWSRIGGVYEKIGFSHKLNCQELFIYLKTSYTSKNFWLSMGL
jgi:hypothetical protein